MQNERRMINVLNFVGLTFLLILLLINQSEAQNRYLKGEYAFTGEKTCVNHWLINPGSPSNPANTPYWVSTHSVQGTVIFKPDGKGSGKASEVEVISPIYTPIPLYPYWSEPSWPFPLPATILGNTNTYNVSFNFTYSVAVNGAITWTITPDGFAGTFLSGNRTGQTFNSDPVTLIGFVARNDETILLATSPGQAEIVTTDLFDNDVLIGRIEGQCHRSRVLIKTGR